MPLLSDLSDVDLLTLLIYGEARNQPVLGQLAVACVVRNRVNKLPPASRTKWAKIMLAPAQFSCFNVEDPNYGLLQQGALILTEKPEAMTNTLRQAQWVAQGVYGGSCQDDASQKATHYLTTVLYDSPACPLWAKGKPLTTAIGSHVFIA